jgi:stearoyl-CoA desaturase (Delta-9 desaturase)
LNSTPSASPTITTDSNDAHEKSESHDQAPLSVRIAVLLAIILPLIGTIAAIILLWGVGFSWLQLGLLVSMYVLTVAGVTVGFHRLYTHRSFETYWPIKLVLAVLGSMAVQGPLLKWVAVHRQHHQHSDTDDDPHSPHSHGSGVRGVLKGIWHAHIGWLFAADSPDMARHVRDIRGSRVVQFVSSFFTVWVAAGLLIPAIIGGVVTGTWTGALLGFIWGGLVRVFLVHHVTWSINSVCHLWGSRPFRSRDESRNNVIFGIIGLGEGWHNNHHAFPTSARHGLHWWQIDLSYIAIRTMEMLGLAWRVRIPAMQAIEAKRRFSRRR